jgi:hypothetical protein
MSDGFMAIDARLLAGEKASRTRSLLGDVHGLGRCDNCAFRRAFTRAHSRMASQPR